MQQQFFSCKKHFLQQLFAKNNISCSANTQKNVGKTNPPSPTQKTMGKENHHEDIPDQHRKKKNAQKRKTRIVQKTGSRGDAE
jgi:hypothetical protein